MAKGTVSTATRQAKEATVADLAERLKGSVASVLVDYRGLDVVQDSELRRRLRAAGVDYRVCKNTLATRAATLADLADLEPLLHGPTAIAFSTDDAAAAARELAAFSKDHEDLQFKGGVLSGRVIGVAEVAALASLPPRAELLARLAAAFAGPMVATASLFSAPLRGFAVVTRQLAEARSGAAGA